LNSYTGSDPSESASSKPAVGSQVAGAFPPTGWGKSTALSNEISRVRFWEARLQQRPAGQHSPSQAPLEAYWQIVRPPVRRWLDC
jgi:hypothetical protein